MKKNRTRVAIVGASETSSVGHLPNYSMLQLHAEAAQLALADAGLTFDDVLLVPSYSEVLPSDVELLSKFSRNLSLKVPVVSAAMDTVTESKMAIAMAQEGGIGVLHKNLTIKQQAEKIRKLKRS